MKELGNHISRLSLVAIGVILAAMFIVNVVTAAEIDTVCTSDGMLNHPCKHWQTHITFNFQQQQP